MPDGETAKKLRTIETLAERLSRLGADRKAVLIALGGGVVGDVTGLLASLYMRGCLLYTSFPGYRTEYTQYITTLDGPEPVWSPPVTTPAPSSL